MPVYDFSCEKCGNVFEVERGFSATGNPRCPKCGSTKTAKMFSAAGIVFKGSGFYVTDSKSKSGDSKPAAADKPLGAGNSSEKPAEKSTDSSETKPAAAESNTPAAAKDPA